MENKILVTYATTHGSTREVAGVVAETMRSRGLQVEVEPVQQVRSLDAYQAVVLGVPLYMFRWQNSGRRFLSRHRRQLCNGTPIAIFTGGATADEKGKVDDDAKEVIRKSVDKELAKFDWLKPLSVEIIGGRFDPEHLRFPWNLIPALKQTPANDQRDWQAIRAWAGSLAEQFMSARAA